MSVFEHYARYYDLLYRDKDYAKETAFVATLLGRHGKDPRSLLELGCGTGIHAALLAASGYSVRGVDASDEMVARANERRESLAPAVAQRLEFQRGDVREPVVGRHDAAISLFHVMSYQSSNDDLRRAFAAARSALPVGGVFVFDCWYGPAVLEQRPENRVKRWEDDAASILRFAEPVWHPNENCVDVHYQIVVTDRATNVATEFRETHRMRYLFLPEIGLLLENAGFTLAWHGEWLTEHALSPVTWNACFVARAL